MTTTETLCAMIRERAAVGLKKYGVTVDRKDLTADQWLQHSIEEKLDDLQYTMRLRAEIRNMERIILRMWKTRKPLQYTMARYAKDPTVNWQYEHNEFCKLAAKIQKRRNNERANHKNRKP